MTNLAIAYRNRADAATLAGGAWSSTLPLSNLADRQQAKVARTQGALQTFTADAATDLLTITAGHGLTLGEAVTVENSGGALPTGLVAGTVYYARPHTATTLGLHTSAAGAIANTGGVNLTGAGSGTNSLRASTGLATTRLRADLGASYTLRCLCLVNHNLSSAARWRVRLGSAALDLDFTDGVLDPRITFTRATVASRINASGLLEMVASGQARFDHSPSTLACRGLLVEESRTNLLQNSNNFRTSSWTRSLSGTMPNAIEGPDGAMSGSLWQATSAASVALQQSLSKAASSLTYTTTWFVKAGTHTGSMTFSLDDGTSTNRGRITVNLGNGSVTGTFNDGTFTNTAGLALETVNGWYRISLTTTTDTGTTIRTRLFWTAADTAAYIYIAHAQLEQAAFPTSYMPSADAWTGRATNGTYVNAAGLIATVNGAARNSYNPTRLSAAPTLLLESIATNLLLRSEEFDNASWTKTNTTVTANALAAPDGTTTADVLTHTGATPGAAQTSAAFTAGDVVVVSVFAKRFAVSNHLRIQLGGLCSAWFNLQTGATGTNDAGSGNVTFARKQIQDFGNGWYRCIFAVYTTTITTLSVDLGACSADNTAPASGQVVAVWGAMAEAAGGTTAIACTSYIATTSATVTRNADTSTTGNGVRNAEDVELTSTNFSAWYTAGQGTFYADFARPVAVSQLSRVLAITDGTANNKAYIGTSAGNNLIAEITTGGVDQATLQFLAGVGANGTAYKQALSYFPNDVAISHAGGAAVTDTVAAIPTVDRLKLGSQNANYYLNGTLARVAYWSTALSDADLVSLTTSGPSALGYDSGWVNAMQMTLDTNLNRWGENYALIAAASANVTARYIEVEIDDESNADGYIEIGRLFAGAGIQPAINAKYGLVDGWVDDNSSVAKAIHGAKFVNKRRRVREVRFELPWITQSEADDIHELQMHQGLTEEVLYIPDPDDAGRTQRYGFVGTMMGLSGIEWPLVDTRATAFKIEELA